jgi:predicted small lipoprotein YifL
MNKNTFALLAAHALIVACLTGCGKKADSSGNPPPSKAGQDATSPTKSALQTVLAVWLQGDNSAAVSRFLETDWRERPLFSPGSTLSLSEAQWVALSYADREAKRGGMEAQAGELKKLSLAVLQAGRDAAANNDSALALKHFAALKQFGEALENPDSLAIVKIRLPDPAPCDGGLTDYS